MPVEVEKIPGGFRIDGLDLRSGKCGCTSIALCCHSWSKVKKRGNDHYEFSAKMTTPETKDHFTWGYMVRKDGISVQVMVEDARDKQIYSGFIPPPASEWKRRGWEVIDSNGDREDGVVWRCAMCKWLYREGREGIAFHDLPSDWRCPRCGVSKEEFERIG